MKNTDWKKKVPGCFGSVDLIWGSHALDEERCREMFKTAIDAEATMEDIVTEARTYLVNKKAASQHVEAQIARIRNLEY